MKPKMEQFTLEDFNYELPKSRIAQKPADPRDYSNLLIFDRQTSDIIDDKFYNLDAYLPNSTTLLLNNSKVEKCRLLFDNCEVFILEKVAEKTVDAMIRPGRKFKKNKKVTLSVSEGIECWVMDILDDGIRRLKFNIDLDDRSLDRFRCTPFPPYIGQDEQLSDKYQTVYAKQSGSKAAPTAGLHFTPQLLRTLKENHPFAEVTLHVGLGTFAPVKSDDLDNHTMHSEWFEISEPTALKLNEAPHITAVGTTSMRVAETIVSTEGSFAAQKGDTDIFIKPGFTFKAIDALITNFHLPKSTLLMLVAAFMGYEQMMDVYKHAIDRHYRFYSFGDAMLIL